MHERGCLEALARRREMPRTHPPLECTPYIRMGVVTDMQDGLGLDPHLPSNIWEKIPGPLRQPAFARDENPCDAIETRRSEALFEQLPGQIHVGCRDDGLATGQGVFVDLAGDGIRVKRLSLGADLLVWRPSQQRINLLDCDVLAGTMPDARDLLGGNANKSKDPRPAAAGMGEDVCWQIVPPQQECVEDVKRHDFGGVEPFLQ